MRTLYLIRHGQASYGAADYDQLSSLGAEQSRLCGAWFRQCGIALHHAIAGGLKRHVQTAEAFFAGYENNEGNASEWTNRIHRDPNWNEVDAIDMMNPAKAARNADAPPAEDAKLHMTFAQFEAAFRPAYYRWTSGQYDHEYAQPFPEYRAGCVSAVEKAFQMTQPDETVAAFTSGGTIGMICRQVMQLNDEATSAIMWQISNTSVSRLMFDRERYVLTLFNSVAHLEQRADKKLLTIF